MCSLGSTFPAASGKVTTVYAKVPPSWQRVNANTFLNFLAGTSITFFETLGLHKLNDMTELLYTIINVQQSNVVKLVYGFGYGASGIINISPLDGKMLLLKGAEGIPRGPQQLIMSVDTCIKELVTCLTELAFL